MYHTRITKIDLASRAADILSYAHYTKIREWINDYQFTGNIKDAITETKDEGIELIRAQLSRNAVPHLAGGDNSARYLRFNVEQEEIKGGLFWNAGGSGSGYWHYVDERVLTP